MPDQVAEVGGLTGVAERLRKVDLESGVEIGFNIADLTTYRVGGPAALFVRPTNGTELLGVAEALLDSEIPVLIVGRGSNMLIADAGFEGLAIQLGSGFEEIRCVGTRLTVGGAASLPVMARHSVAEGLTGLEWAVGVPGSLGGAVRMNAGGHGSEMAEVLVDVTILDLTSAKMSVIEASELNLGYRRSAVTSRQVVVSATLDLAKGDRESGAALLTEIVRWRRENQPGGQNSGSVFTNPPGDSAGRLIELAGGKGLRIGSACVSKRHANFIQADQDGSADDVFDLMGEIRELVMAAHGIDLVAETVLVGFGDTT
ncbi:MAG: UDP-N-acetylmuramate dehydrogenase [Acidimicrobiia bacterium]|nr:UDP-N-acetylmuramate dehydrogenase [Acidimicrobiia bacterium]